MHPLVLPTDFTIPLWQHHHSFEGVWTKEPVGHHSALSKSAGSTTRETPSIVGNHFPGTPWVFPGTLHPAAELPQGGSCTFLSLPFSLGSSVPGFQAQFTAYSGLHSDRVCLEQWDALTKSLVVALATQGGHLHRGNLTVPGGPLGEGGVFLCRDCHLVVTSETLSPLKATLSPRLCWEGAGKN